MKKSIFELLPSELVLAPTRGAIRVEPGTMLWAQYDPAPSIPIKKSVPKNLVARK